MENDSGKIIKNRYQILAKEETFIFDKFTYKEEFFNKILTKEEYTMIIDEVNKYLSVSNDLKKKNDQIVLPKGIKLLTIITWIFALIYSISMFLLLSFPANNKNLLKLCFTSIGLCIFISVGLTLFDFFRKLNIYKGFFEIVDEELTKYFIKVHEKYEHKFEFKYILGKNVLDVKIFENEENKNNIDEKKDTEEEFEESDTDSEDEVIELSDDEELKKDNSKKEVFNIHLKQDSINVAPDNDSSIKKTFTSNNNFLTQVNKEKILTNLENQNFIQLDEKSQNNCNNLIEEVKSLNKGNLNFKNNDEFIGIITNNKSIADKNNNDQIVINNNPSKLKMVVKKKINFK